MAAGNKHCEKLMSLRIRICSLWIWIWTVDRKSKGRRFKSCARSIFRNAYFLQPFWWLYVVTVLVTLKVR